MNHNNLSEKEQIEFVKRHCWNVQYLEAIKEWIYSIQFIKNPTEQVQFAAIQQDKDAYQYIKNPTERVKRLINFS
jgi:hypothetical protein